MGILNTGIEEGKRTEIAGGLLGLMAETYTLSEDSQVSLNRTALCFRTSTSCSKSTIMLLH